MADFPAEDLAFFRHHLFLPPCLPQADDQSFHLDDALLLLVYGVLDNFGGLVPEEQRPVVYHIADTIEQMIQTRTDSDGVVHEVKLLKAFQEMSKADCRE